MRKLIKNTLTTVTALLVVVTASAVASEGFTFVEDDTTGIVLDTEVGVEDEENEVPVQPLSDMPPRDAKEEPLS